MKDEKYFLEGNYDKSHPYFGKDTVNFFMDDDPTDMVNSPSHYTSGRYEAIDIIEDAISEAPSPMHGLCQGNALKYLLRLWHKIDAKEDAEKARWYLNKLIDLLN